MSAPVQPRARPPPRRVACGWCFRPIQPASASQAAVLRGLPAWLCLHDRCRTAMIAVCDGTNLLDAATGRGVDLNRMDKGTVA